MCEVRKGIGKEMEELKIKKREEERLVRGGRGSGNGANCSDGWDKMEEDKLNSFVHLGKRPDTRAFLVLVCRYLVLFAIFFPFGEYFVPFWVFIRIFGSSLCGVLGRIMFFWSFCGFFQKDFWSFCGIIKRDFWSFFGFSNLKILLMCIFRLLCGLPNMLLIRFFWGGRRGEEERKIQTRRMKGRRRTKRGNDKGEERGYG